MPDLVQVLVVEDESVAARAHCSYVNRVPGFVAVGSVSSAGACLRRLSEGLIDLVLLDLHLPDSVGLDLYRRIRSGGFPVDVMVVSSAREGELVRGALALGAVQYLIKPFTFAAMRDKLLAYGEFRLQIGFDSESELIDQAAVDRALSSLRAPSARSLPKGMSVDTLEAVVAALTGEDAVGSESADGVSATVVGTAIGASRITARRYLEYLTEEGLLHRSLRYGVVGRPETLYRRAARR